MFINCPVTPKEYFRPIITLEEREKHYTPVQIPLDDGRERTQTLPRVLE